MNDTTSNWIEHIKDFLYIASGCPLGIVVPELSHLFLAQIKDDLFNVLGEKQNQYPNSSEKGNEAIIMPLTLIDKLN